ncbi:MAG TPA: YggS family pyridoxal phosphate-dependent enzyme [Clostridiaceae bacterium]|jgi:hypothetical protein|nr:YggS family pyridoxal phosphate-dependent enzyme [Clostridiaceae bacterium]HBF77633.1 YggS family pyridoxal phosphate-dependent enzyme [Clostridiaceae bacterium]HBG38739.1 YggS family pyridoxal phosphate-dependent enzyme [Clostridiaceae bacterium]HBN28474.1 YggS family pyridoxal phosphate-dependent enzyme [Clostridiaceae bacterium]HBX49186.1 YggS family pyridoxal phosphate-dependent enzyme [Clostridiaceae bacterium]
MTLEEKVHLVQNNIECAAKKSGRNKDDILLVAASKMQTADKIKEAQNCGLSVFGENKAQELLEKYPYIDNVKWHFIGHLQKNKVKSIIDKVELIHSVDSIELLEEIDKRSKSINKVMPVLIQINIGKEETKSGINEDEVDSFLEKAIEYKNIKISGFMAIPPKVENKEDSRVYFTRMKSLFDRVKDLKCPQLNIKYLSMGMTNDYEIAIEEGANIVRVGTGIFGERKY